MNKTKKKKKQGNKQFLFIYLFILKLEVSRELWGPGFSASGISNSVQVLSTLVPVPLCVYLFILSFLVFRVVLNY